MQAVPGPPVAATPPPARRKRRAGAGARGPRDADAASDAPGAPGALDVPGAPGAPGAPGVQIDDNDLLRMCAQIDAVPGAAAPTMYETNRCPDCGARVEQVDGQYVCGSCGRAHVAGDEDDNISDARPAVVRVRMFGADARELQRHVDSSSVAKYDDARHKHVYDDYLSYLSAYTDMVLPQRASARPVPQSVCATAAEIYAELAATSGSHRAHRKQTIMAACLHFACVRDGFFLSPQECALFMQLHSTGTSSGMNYVVEANAARPLTTVDVNTDPRPAMINTALYVIGFAREHGAAAAAAVAAATLAVLDVVATTNAAVKMQQKTRVNGALYAVLRRRDCAAGAPAAQHSHTKFEVQCKIRLATIRGFLGVLAAYHSRFVDVYQRHGLCSHVAPLGTAHNAHPLE